jgi:hypothetical protein
MKEIIAAALASGAVFSFVQFMITFAFSRKDKTKDLEEKLDRQDQKIDEVRDKIDENAAILARTHILRFSDELRNGVEHSNEYFRQQLDDCDTYNRYCKTHPEFKNSYTELADKYIKETYERLTKEGKL